MSGAGLSAPYSAVHDGVQWDFSAGRGMRVADARSYLAAIDCRAALRGLLAPGRVPLGAPRLPPSSDGVGEDPGDLMRPDHSMKIAQACNA